MGYITDYELHTSKPIYISELNDITNYVWDSNIDEKPKTNNFILYGVKWYKHDEDMKLLSKKHPDILFELYGNGEEDGDMWKAYYKNGKSYVVRAIISYPEFDEKLLS